MGGGHFQEVVVKGGLPEEYGWIVRAWRLQCKHNDFMFGKCPGQKFVAIK